MDLITYGLLNKAKANLDSPAFTGTPTAPTPATTDNTTKLATTEFVRSFVATLKGFYLGVTTTTLVDEVTTSPDVVINGETVTAQDGNWVIADGGEEFVYSGTVWQKFGDSNWISVIGNTYNPALTYNTGDCVIYMDGLYECQEDNVTGDWDSTKWQATTIIDLITGGIPLENLSNVNIVNPQAGNHLVFDGTEWKNSTVVSPALSELSDVELENVTDGQALVYNDEIDKWENKDIPTGEVTNTATGNPIELTDAASAPMVKCVTAITGSQDLHGYDKPWVGGAGENKFDINSLASSPSASVSVSGNVATLTAIYNGYPNVTIDVSQYAGKTIYISVTSMVRNSESTSLAVTAIQFVYNDGTNHYQTVCDYANNVASCRNSAITIPSGVTAVLQLFVNNGTVQVVGDTVVITELEISLSQIDAYEPYSNICPITAYTEGEIEVRGKNLFNKNASDIAVGFYLIASTGVLSPSQSGYNTSGYIPIEPNTYYTKSGASVAADEYCFFDSEKTFISGLSRTDTTVLSPNNAAYMRFDYKASETDNIQIEKGSTATDYEPYTSTTHTTTYPSAIFRGSEDVVNGSETHDRKYIDSNITSISRGSLDSSGLLYRVYNNSDIKLDSNQNPIFLICNKYDVVSLGECRERARNGEKSCCGYGSTVYIGGYVGSESDLDTELLTIQFAYETEPTTSSVTPTNLPIKSLSGYSHIESSTGDMEVEYITEEYQPLVDLIEDDTTHIVPNPSGTATEILNKLGIDNIIYDFPKELPTVTSTDNEKVLTVVNGVWAKADPQTGVSESVVADEYDPSETYNIADYCMYSGKLYKCNTANTTGAWDSSKWDETCVGDELTLKTAVIVAPRVDQTATYTYNGTEQTLAFEYINSNNTIVTGNKHTDAGTYTCTVSLKNPNDLWSDTMDNVDKTFTWTINKVTSSITLSPTTFYFDNGTPQTLTATVVGQPLVLSGYDTNLITVTQVSVVSGVYTYTIKASGTAGTTTITASIAESTNYTAASATASVETEAFTPGATLVPWSSGSDQEITDMINSYYNGEITLEDVKSVWSIGDVRNVDISAMTATGVGESHRAQTVQMEILDFDHDTLTTPIGSITKALITVDMKNCLRDANVTDTTGSSNTEHGYINSSNTNVGGWTSCARRTWCNNIFYNALPSYFKSLVKPVDKLTSAGNTSSIINTDSDYCFLLSEIEIFGSISYSKAGEGSQYAWFANATANRYKLPKWNSSSVSDFWWERSPFGSVSSYFCRVNITGDADYGNASGASGLAPACCL